VCAVGLRQPPKELVADRVAWGEAAGDLPKNCHLLPFWSRKTAKPVATVSFRPWARRHPGKPGSKLRTASGAERSLGEKLSPSAVS
jgi:hypothetical protein